MSRHSSKCRNPFRSGMVFILCVSAFLCFLAMRSTLPSSQALLQGKESHSNSFSLLQSDPYEVPAIRCPGTNVLTLLLRQRNNRFCLERKKRSTPDVLPETDFPRQKAEQLLLYSYSLKTERIALLSPGLFQPCTNTPTRAGPGISFV